MPSNVIRITRAMAGERGRQKGATRFTTPSCLRGTIVHGEAYLISQHVRLFFSGGTNGGLLIKALLPHIGGGSPTRRWVFNKINNGSAYT